jgi:hypothetical protein
MEYEHRVIIRALFKENTNADNIHGRFQSQFTDDIYSIRSVRPAVSASDKGEKNLHGNPRSGRPPIGCIDAKILSALEKEPFRSTHSLAGVMYVSNSTIIRHLRDSLGMKNSICAGCHMN